MNQVLKLTIGFALGPLVIVILIQLILNAFKDKYYLFITKDLMCFVVTDTEAILTLSASQFVSIKSSIINGNIHITYEQDQEPGKNERKGKTTHIISTSR